MFPPSPGEKSLGRAQRKSRAQRTYIFVFRLIVKLVYMYICTKKLPRFRAKNTYIRANAVVVYSRLEYCLARGNVAKNNIKINDNRNPESKENIFNG